MNVKQKFKLLIFTKWNKASANGEEPIYVGIKIYSDEDEIFLCRRITEEGMGRGQKSGKIRFRLAGSN